MDLLSEAIQRYCDERLDQKLEPLIKKRDQALKKCSSEAQIAQVTLDYNQAHQELAEKFSPANWLDDAVKRAGQISMATHALKFTHSDAKGSGVLALERTQHPTYLTTSSLNSISVDAVGNAAALDVAKLLQLEIEGVSLASRFEQDDWQALKPFARSEAQLTEWKAGFSKALNEQTLSSHSLAKQIYFPLETGDYHLLAPLYSSSMAQALYERIRETRFGEQAKEIRDARRKEKYHPEPTVSFPNVAIQEFGGSKPQNVSLNNSGRRGQGYLLNAAPPQWQTQTKPPLSDIFNDRLNRRCRQSLNTLHALIGADRDANLETRKQREQLENQLLDTVFEYALEVQQFGTGWSDQPECQLPLYQKLWLDPDNPDQAFQDARTAGGWKLDLRKAFANWLIPLQNNNSHGAVLGEAEAQHWRQLFDQALFECGGESLGAVYGINEQPLEGAAP